MLLKLTHISGSSVLVEMTGVEVWENPYSPGSRINRERGEILVREKLDEIMALQRQLTQQLLVTT